MKLVRKDFGIWKHDIFILPTFRVYINNMLYSIKNFSIEFHWIVFHARLLFVPESEDTDG